MNTLLDMSVQAYFSFLISQGIDPHCVEFDPMVQAIIDASTVVL